MKRQNELQPNESEQRDSWNDAPAKRIGDMLAWLEQFLVRYPELTLFLVIAVGYSIGEFRFGAFSLGPVTGALFAGLIVGHFAHVPVSSMTKSFLFLLFLFGVGYSVGPQFMQALRRDGLKPVLLAVVVTSTGLAVSIVIAKLLKLDAGFAAGLMSGALSQSAAMGTATDAVNALSLPEADRARLVAHIAVADAVCYIFGYAGVIIFSTVVAPWLLRIDLKVESRKLEQSLGINRSTPGLASGWRKFELRAYKLKEGAPLVGMTIAAAESRASEHRLFVQRLRQGGQVVDLKSGTTLRAGDVVAVSGPRAAIVDLIGAASGEIEDKELLDFAILAVDVLVMKAVVAGKTLLELSDEEWAHGLYLREIRRGGQLIPVAPNLTLERGDVLRLVGPEPVVQAAASEIGAIVAPNNSIDFTVLGLAIFIGGLVGVLLTFSIGGIRISLSTSVGALLAGLLVGHMRTRYPLFGRIPDGAIALMTSLGLAAFVGMTGIHAGPIFISSVLESGVGLLLGGMVVTLAPQLIGLAFGHLVLRMNPILLLGGLTGSQTVTAAMAAVQERSGSPVAVLGYTPAYPIANILMTTWGTIMVAIFAS